MIWTYPISVCLENRTRHLHWELGGNTSDLTLVGIEDQAVLLGAGRPAPCEDALTASRFQVWQRAYRLRMYCTGSRSSILIE